MNNIIHGDSITELLNLKDNSIDLILTDPPYFIHKLDSNWSADKINEDKKNSHIKHIPKGMKFSKTQVKELYDYYLEVSNILYKKLKPGGYFLSFSSPRLYHAIAMAKEIAGFEIRDTISWIYTQTLPKGMSINHVIDRLDINQEQKETLKVEYNNFKTPQVKSCHEPICVAMKPFHGSFIKNELNFKTGLIDFNQKVGKDKDKVPANVVVTDDFHDMYTKNFFVNKPSKKEKGEDNKHITVKPVALIEHLIKLFSKENSQVLDPFLGSGTTALACANVNRNCIGIEINEEYYKTSLKRLGK